MHLASRLSSRYSTNKVSLTLHNRLIEPIKPFVDTFSLHHSRRFDNVRILRHAIEVQDFFDQLHAARQALLIRVHKQLCVSQQLCVRCKVLVKQRSCVHQSRSVRRRVDDEDDRIDVLHVRSPGDRHVATLVFADIPRRELGVPVLKLLATEPEGGGRWERLAEPELAEQRRLVCAWKTEQQHIALASEELVPHCALLLTLGALFQAPAVAGKVSIELAGWRDDSWVHIMVT